jgi:hypothetical protein
MNNDVHRTYYVECKHIRSKQRDLEARLSFVEKGKGASSQGDDQEQDDSEAIFSFRKWNEGSLFYWKELAEVTSKGKQTIDEEDDEEDDGSGEDEDDEDDDDFEDE